jgi:hypothetical protein
MEICSMEMIAQVCGINCAAALILSTIHLH